VDPNRASDFAARSVQASEGRIGIDAIGIHPDRPNQLLLSQFQIPVEYRVERGSQRCVDVPRTARAPPERPRKPAHGLYEPRSGAPPG
jgi:hypothetical protein